MSFIKSISIIVLGLEHFMSVLCCILTQIFNTCASA